MVGLNFQAQVKGHGTEETREHGCYHNKGPFKCSLFMACSSGPKSGPACSFPPPLSIPKVLKHPMPFLTALICFYYSKLRYCWVGKLMVRTNQDSTHNIIHQCAWGLYKDLKYRKDWKIFNLSWGVLLFSERYPHLLLSFLEKWQCILLSLLTN